MILGMTVRSLRGPLSGYIHMYAHSDIWLTRTVLVQNEGQGWRRLSTTPKEQPW